MPGIFVLPIQQNADFILTLDLTDANGIPLNLTGYSARASIKNTPQDTLPLVSFTIVFDPNPLLGKLVISLTAAQTKLLPANGARYNKTTSYLWDFLLVDASGKVVRLLEGTVNVSPGVTV
jgi:hypothetical protein